jgi:hypothetical protein
LAIDAKKNGTSTKPLPFIYGFFQKAKAHNMLAMILNLRFKGLWLVIQYVGKERIVHIASEYDHQVSFRFLICAYEYLNPNDVSVGVPSFASQTIEPTSLYDLIELMKRWHY